MVRIIVAHSWKQGNKLCIIVSYLVSTFNFSPLIYLSFISGDRDVMCLGIFRCIINVIECRYNAVSIIICVSAFIT